MPYRIERQKGKFAVVKEDDGKVMGTHPIRAKAKAQLSALYAAENKSTSKESIKSMMDMGALEYAKQECWDIQSASSALAQIAMMAVSEVDEPQDIETLADVMYSLLEFIRGEIDEMESSAKEGAVEEPEEVKSISAEVKSMNLDYVKSINPSKNIDFAVKYVAKNEILHPVFLWGSDALTDLEKEYFTRPINGNGTDFWDEVLGKSTRPLTWDHAQDPDFDADPVIGKTMDWYDDEVARWAVSKLETGHKYRKAIDALIEKKALGSASIAQPNPVIGASSDSAPQYVKRVKTGKSTWLARWPWFATALTVSPCEPRMIDSDKGVAFLKSLGVALPDTRGVAWEWQKQRLLFSRLSNK